MTERYSKQTHSKPKRVRYDFNELKSNIPILNVARDLGLHPQRKGPNWWCRVRPEDHEASVILHEDTNRFHDFGINRGGDVIDFAAFAMSVDLDTAQEWLGQTYHMTPKFRSKSSGVKRDELSLWEYEAIGISGDLATKNFRFNTEDLTPDILRTISDRYSMSMNELRKAYPNIYTSILIQKAVPYVQELRNEYLLSLWSLHQLVREIGNPDLFQRQCRNGAFRDQIQELERAEQILIKASKGTSLKRRPTRAYDPVQDLEDLLSDKLTPQLGTLSMDEMKTQSRVTGSEILQTELDYRIYGTNLSLQEIPHAAFWQSGIVKVDYLDRDHSRIQSAIHPSLTDKISEAETRLNPVEHGLFNTKFYHTRS